MKSFHPDTGEIFSFHCVKYYMVVLYAVKSHIFVYIQGTCDLSHCAVPVPLACDTFHMPHVGISSSLNRSLVYIPGAYEPSHSAVLFAMFGLFVGLDP